MNRYIKRISEFEEIEVENIQNKAKREKSENKNEQGTCDL